MHTEISQIERLVTSEAARRSVNNLELKISCLFYCPRIQWIGSHRTFLSRQDLLGPLTALHNFSDNNRHNLIRKLGSKAKGTYASIKSIGDGLGI